MHATLDSQLMKYFAQKPPLQDAFLAQNTIQIRLRACRRPSILSPVKPLRHQTLETPFRRFNKVPIPWDGTQGDPREAKGRLRGPKGTQGQPTGGDPTVPTGAKGSQGEPRGAQGRLRRPWEGMGPGPFGIILKPFRMESNFAWKVIMNGKIF